MAKASNKRKKSTIVIVAILCVIAVGGMLAYLTDRDSEVNVFTVGNVNIDLIEDYKQGSELKPGVEIKKEAHIKNEGPSDAWVWMTVAVPQNATDAILTDEPGAGWTKLNEIKNTEINSEKYNVYTLLYDTALTSGAETTLGMSKVYLDERVDAVNGEYYWVEDGNTTHIDFNIANAKVYVNAYAIQKAGFVTPAEAYEAYKDQWGENGDEYAEPGTIVENEADLKAALIAGENVILANDINADFLNISKPFNIDLNENTLTVNSLLTKANVNISNGTIAHGQIEYEDKYGFVYEGNSAICVESGKLTLNSVDLNCEVPCTLKINNNSTVEMVGIHILDGDVVFNDSDINIKSEIVYGKLIQAEGLFGACIDGGTLTMNNSEITLSGLGGRDASEYFGILARTGNEKVVNLNNSKIDDSAMFYVLSAGSGLTVNTTDKKVDWTGKTYGTMTVNYK